MADHDKTSEPHGAGMRTMYIVWAWLLALTALEVFLAYLQVPLLVMLLSLIGLSMVKAALIVAYFMHMKFEGWICKVLIAPTIPLMCVVFFALVPDIASNDRMNHEIADQLDPLDGDVTRIGTGSRNKVKPEYAEAGADGAPAAGH